MRGVHLKNLDRENLKAKRDANFNSKLEKLKELHNKIQEGYKVVPKSIQNLYLSVFIEKGSRTQRIKLKCLDCCCWDKEEVRQCTARQCSLWEVRPYKQR